MWEKKHWVADKAVVSIRVELKDNFVKFIPRMVEDSCNLIFA